MKLDASAQFRGIQVEHVYMNGAAMSCGQHPSLPRQHRWDRWEVMGEWADGSVRKTRCCRVCALTESN